MGINDLALATVGQYFKVGVEGHASVESDVGSSMLCERIIVLVDSTHCSAA
jgi:hypothetical protein